MSGIQEYNKSNDTRLSSNLLLAIAAFEAPLKQAINDAENYLQRVHGINAFSTDTHDSTYRGGPDGGH